MPPHDPAISCLAVTPFPIASPHSPGAAGRWTDPAMQHLCCALAAPAAAMDKLLHKFVFS
jgi:hypothetical protein